MAAPKTLLELAGAKPSSGLDGVSVAGLLLGKGKFADRPLFWHFPHYNNQGGRPGGVIREGNWKLIEFYDTEKAELYDLRTDSGEEKDRAADQPDRVKAMRAKLADWRKSIKAQENTLNRDFDPELYRKLYIDTDVSRLRPARRAAEMTRKLAEWRKTMDRVVPRKPKKP